MQEELRKIARKRTLTEEEKEFVRTCSAELKVEFEPSIACQNCYQDQAILLLKTISDKEGKSKPRDTFGLREDIDVKWRGVRVNVHTITADIKEKMLLDGLKHFFPDDNRD